MEHSPALRLPVALAPAIQGVKKAVRQAAELAVDAFARAAQAALPVEDREALRAAQHVLGRNLHMVAAAFEGHLDAGLANSSGEAALGAAASDWSSLSLVDDDETERRMQADRLGNTLAQACEAALATFDSLVSALLALPATQPRRNPLRPAVVASALLHALEGVGQRQDVRDVVAAEVARQLVAPLAQAYLAAARELEDSGVRPVAVSWRATERAAPSFSRSQSGHEPTVAAAQPASGYGALRGAAGGQASRADMAQTLGAIDGEMRALIRNLTQQVAAPAGQTGALPSGAMALAGDSGVNLIHAHRDALRHAATGALDHLVIDVVGILFDQILADPKVPPQMARQIARLQLPVLRAALGDTSFFSSRRHPVRRFINRIASLGSAVDDFDDEHGQRLVARVRDLVQEVVDGDFEQIELYEQKLRALEEFVAEQAQQTVQAQGGAASLLAEREIDLRQQQRYSQALHTALRPLAMPDFLRDFLAHVWSQALLRTARAEGLGGARAKLLRLAGRELFLSVQPKGAPEQRKRFLAALPGLMKQLSEGLALIGWPDAARAAFFAQLLPAHAESLRGQALSTLDFNLLVKQIDLAFATPLPTADASAPAGPAISDELAAAVFSPAEAQRIGLLNEAAVDWDGTVDIDLSAEPEVTLAELQLQGLPQPEAPEPASGRMLLDHMQIGFAYQMYLSGQWQKVRLSHISPARAFFVFSHGKRNLKSVSMTTRMLARMCETQRVRAFENAYLIERATARARRQLAALGVGKTPA